MHINFSNQISRARNGERRAKKQQWCFISIAQCPIWYWVGFKKYWIEQKIYVYDSDHLLIANIMIPPLALGVVILTWQNPVHSWKAGPGEIMTVDNKKYISHSDSFSNVWQHLYYNDSLDMCWNSFGSKSL